MNEVLKVIKERRSTRRFKTEQISNKEGNALIINNLSEWLRNQKDGSNYSALNFIREAILQLNKPILFWVNDTNLPNITNLAPDFFSQRRMSTLNFLTKDDK